MPSFDYIVNNFLLFFVVPFIAFLAVFVIWNTFQDLKRLKGSFTITNPVLGRDKEIDQLARQILSGNSCALVGIFDQEHTMILDALRNPQNFNKFYGEGADRLIFSYVDVSTFTPESTPVDFWKRALMSLESVDSEQIQKLRQTCDENQYGDYYLDKLMEQLRREERRLILLVYKFDWLFSLKSFNAGVFALLRRLTSSHHPSAFVTMITMNMTNAQLMSSDKILGLQGSNLLSFTMEMILSPLPGKRIESLLADKNYTQLAHELTGNFPYLVFLFNQVLAEIEDEKETLAKEEVETKVRELFRQRVDKTIQDALASHFFLTGGKSSDLKSLLNNLSAVDLPDKKELEKMGVLLKIDDDYHPNLFLKSYMS